MSRTRLNHGIGRVEHSGRGTIKHDRRGGHRGQQPHRFSGVRVGSSAQIDPNRRRLDRQPLQPLLRLGLKRAHRCTHSIELSTRSRRGLWGRRNREAHLRGTAHSKPDP